MDKKNFMGVIGDNNSSSTLPNLFFDYEIIDLPKNLGRTDMEFNKPYLFEGSEKKMRCVFKKSTGKPGGQLHYGTYVAKAAIVNPRMTVEMPVDKEFEDEGSQ